MSEGSTSSKCEVLVPKLCKYDNKSKNGLSSQLLVDTSMRTLHAYNNHHTLIT